MALPATPTPIVPSKNALRALRRLALSPSIYVVGTLGSICGIATLNYEVNRKVRLAEQVVERKRMLRSISSGRGAKQLNAMFEAAERGEDFTRPHKHTSTRKISTRAFSAVAVHEPSEGNHDLPPEGPAADPNVPARFVKIRRYASGSIPRLENSSTAVETHTDGRDSTASGKMVEAREEEYTSMVDRSIPPGQLYKPQILGNGTSTSSSSVFAAFPSDISLYAAEAGSLNPASPLLSGPAVRFVDPFWREEPLPLDKNSAAPVSPRRSKRRSTASKEQETSSKLPVERPASDLRFISLAPPLHNAERARPNASKSFELMIHPEDDSIDQALRDHLKTMENSQYSPIHVKSMVEYAPSAFIDHVGKNLDSLTLAAVDQFIQPTNIALSKRARLGRWLAVMRRSILPSNPDWTMAEAVFLRYRHHFESRDLHAKPVFELIRHLLALDSMSTRPQWILFPDTYHDLSGAIDSKDASEVFELAVKYLTFFCEQNQSSSACFREMERIIGLGRRCGLRVPESLVSPVFRTMARSRDFQVAETDFLDKIESLFDAAESPRVLGEYAFCQAREGNWEGVRLVLDKLHQHDYSRKAPSTFGRMFHKILLQFSAKNSALRTMQFTIDNIKYVGLIPTGAVSQTIICACVREHRYDLVAEWIRLTREAFPRVSLGFENARGAWVLANTLMEMGASCQDVSAVCLRIALGRRLDPFDDSFRHHARELVRLDLMRRLSAAASHQDSGTLEDSGIESMTLNQLFEEAYQFTIRPTSNDRHLDFLKSELAAQLVAIGELASIFRGDIKMLFARSQPVEPVKKNRSPLPHRKSHAAIQSDPAFDTVFPRGSSTGIEEVAATVAKHYASREKQDLPVDHSLLRNVIITFGSEHPTEILQLVEAIYASNFVQSRSGAPFDSEIFQEWLQLVTARGSVQSAAAALWAILDSARHINWTVHFVYLSLFASQVQGPKNSVWGERVNIDNASNEELQYLQERILHIQRHALGGVEEGFHFPAWIPWEFSHEHALKEVKSGAIRVPRIFR